MGWRGAALAVTVCLAPGAGLAQDRLVDPAVTWKVYDAPPPGLDSPPLTAEGIAAAKGNILRWRDAERARVGAYSRENEAANATRLREYQDERYRQLQKNRWRPPPAYAPPQPLPVGPLLPTIGGYFWHAYEENGRVSGALVLGRWSDERSNAGEPSTMWVATVHGDRFCGNRQVSVADVAWLGPELTSAVRAVEEPFLRPPSERVLDISDTHIERLPTASVYGRYYPARALERERQGDMGALCVLAAEGPAACSLASESPAGWGFGAAGLAVAANYAFGPALKDGSPAAGRTVCVRIAFRLE